MKKIITLLLACAMIASLFTISAFAAEPVNDWICEDDGGVGIWLNDVDEDGNNRVEGAAFNAGGEWKSVVFKTVWGSPNAEDTIGWGIRVKLYAYDTNYATSVKGTPLATKEFKGESNIGRTYTDENGEKKTRPEGVEIDFGKTFAAGKYVFTVECVDQVDMSNKNHFWAVLPKCEFMATDLLKVEFGRSKFGFGIKFTDGGKLLNMDEDPEKVKEAEELAKKEAAEKEREATYGNTPLFNDAEGAKSATGWWFREGSIAESIYVDVTFTSEKWFSGTKVFFYSSTVNKACMAADLKDEADEIIATASLELEGDGWYIFDFEKQIEPGTYIIEFIVAEDFEEESCYCVLGSAESIPGIDEEAIIVDNFGALTNENTLTAPRMYLLNCAEGVPAADATEEPTPVPTIEVTAVPTAAPTTAPTAEPAEENETGCKSVIGSGAVIMVAACAILLRKKED